MRIAVLVPGGVAREGRYRVIPAVLSLLERLAARHDVHVVVPHQEPEPGRWPLLGTTVHNVVARPWQPVAARKLLELHAASPFDVIQALWARGPGEAALFASVATGVPYVVHLAGGELVWHPTSGFGARGWRRALARIALGRAAAVTAASSAMIGLAESAGVRARRVPLGVDLDRWRPRSPRRRPHDRPLRLVTVGSLTPVKGHDVLLAAVDTLRRTGVPVVLDVVGEDTSGSSTPRLARELGLLDTVIFHGFVDQEDLVGLVARADLYVVSSWHEAGPVAMREAAAVGVPTVGTAVGHVADWARSGAAVAVPVGDASALASAIRGLVDDEDARAGIAHAAQGLAVAEDADWTARVLEALYEEVRGAGVPAGTEAPAAVGGHATTPSGEAPTARTEPPSPPAPGHRG